MPDDYNNFYYTCECGRTYHSAEGCTCEQCAEEGCENRVLYDDLCDECEDNRYQETRERNDSINRQPEEEE